MKHQFLPQLYGVVKDYHPRMIADNKVSDCLNVMFKQGRVRSRWGYSKWGGNLPLNGGIMGIAFYERPRSGAKYTIITTTRDAYVYSNSSGRFNFITPMYNTGHATSDTLAVLGSGTTWDSTNWDLDVYQIKFGSDDMNTRKIAITGDTTGASPDITNASSVANMYMGLVVSGVGIPTGSRIIGISGTTITLDQNCTVTDTGIDIEVDIETYYSVASVDSATGITLNALASVVGTTASGSPIVSATDTTDLCAGMAVDGTGITASSWIISIDSLTQFTMNNNATANGSPTLTFGVAITTNADYVLRLCFSGDTDNEFNFAFPYADTYGGNPFDDKIFCLTNGIQPIYKWDGESDSLEVLGGSPNPAKYIGYYGASLFEHLISAWTVDGGDNLPQTVEVSDAGDPEGWSGAYYDLLTTNDEITGMEALGTRLVIYKENSISLAWASPSGGIADPLDFEQNKITTVGTKTGKTIIDLGAYHIFLGNDNVYMFNGISVQPIGTEIINTLMSEINQPYASRSFAFAMRAENLYCLFIPTGEVRDGHGDIIKEASEYPDKGYIFNYVENTWTIWELGHQITCQGFMRNEYAPTWAEMYDSGQLWEELEMRWTDLITYQNDISMVLGDTSGDIYELRDVFWQDDTGDMLASFITKDYPLNDPKHTFMLNEVVLGYVAQGEGDEARVRVSVDFGVTWSDWETVDIGGGFQQYQESIVNFVRKGKQVRFQFENIGGSPFYLENINIGFNEERGKYK